MPAATKLTSVEVSATSIATIGEKPWSAQVASTAAWTTERALEG